MTSANLEDKPIQAFNAVAQPKPKRLRAPGASRLSRACEKILRRDGERLAQALFERAAEGNVSSAKLLIKIIEVEARRLRIRQRKAAERQKLAASGSSRKPVD